MTTNTKKSKIIFIDTQTNRTMSQRARILLHLVTYEKISNKECNEMYGFRHLPSIIRDLRNQGINIKSEKRYGLNKFKQQIYYYDYILAPEEQQSELAQEIIQDAIDDYILKEIA